MSAPNPTNPQMGGAPKKKVSPVVIILAVVAGLVVIVTLLMVAGGLFVYTKAKQAGFDPEMMKENPGLAVAKMVAAMNPDVDVVDVDEGAGQITLRDKKSGKTVTVDFDDVKEGRITFQGDEGEKMTFDASGGGEEGSLRLKSSEGTFEIGAAASGKVPGWVPAYPGAAPEAVMSGETPEGRGGTVTFTTSDSVTKVMEFYTGALKRDGFEVNSMQHGGAEAGAMVTGETPGGKRNVVIMIGTGKPGTTAAVSFSEKD